MNVKTLTSLYIFFKFLLLKNNIFHVDIRVIKLLAPFKIIKF